MSTRDLIEVGATSTHQRVCAVPGCVALAAETSDKCGVHVNGQPFGRGRPLMLCCQCHRPVRETDWIRTPPHDDGSVEHVRCPPARDAAGKESQP